MKRGKKIDTWFPLWIDKWIFGSTRHELIIKQEEGGILDLRGIFLDLMSLAKKDGGFIRANENTPYPIEQMAGMFCVPPELLRMTIEICKKTGKLSEPSPGIYYLNSNDDYSLTDRHKRRLEGEADTMSENPDIMSENADPILKERKEKNIKKENNKESVDFELTDLLIFLMKQNNPNSSIVRRLTPTGRESWANSCRLLRERDGMTPENIRAVIQFSQADDFWKTNILSMPTLRKQWDKLWLKMRQWPSANTERDVGRTPKRIRSADEEAAIEAARKREARRASLRKRLYDEAGPKIKALQAAGNQSAIRAIEAEIEKKVEEGTL